MIGDRPIGKAEFGHGFGDLVERLMAIAPRGMIVQRTLEVAPFDQARKRLFPGQREFARVFAHLGRNVMQVELLKILARAKTTALFVTHQINEAVFLSDRVVVFSARPAGIKEVIAVDLPPERSLSVKLQPAFLQVEQRIWRLIEQEAQKTSMLTVA